MADRVLTIKQVATERLVPFSEASLYRIANHDPDSPFRKRGGRWMVVESDLLRWVREGRQGDRGQGGNPMPRPKGSRAKGLLAEVQQMRQSRA